MLFAVLMLQQEGDKGGYSEKLARALYGMCVMGLG